MNLSSVDLNLLVVLHVMLEEWSVSRTAQRLNVTPSAISNALGRLRSVFDDPLFVRRGRGVVPTPRALALRESLAVAVRELESVVAEPEQDPAATTRTLTLALSDSDQVTRLPALAARMGAAMPAAHLEIVSIDTLIARGGLEGAGASAAMSPHDDPALHGRHLYDEQGVLVVRAGHPLLRKRRHRRAFFESLRHVDVHVVLGGRGHGHSLAEQELQRVRIHRNVAVTVPTFTAAAMIAGSTDLVAGIPVRMVDALGRSLRLVVLEDFSPPGLTFPMYLTWHERTDQDPVERMFRDLVAASFGQEDAAG